MRYIHAVSGLAAIAFAVGCGDGGPLTSPGSPTVRPPHFGISDGANANGNPGFFFLPPMVAHPGGDSEFNDDVFRSDLSPVVRICELDAQDISQLSIARCVSTIREFATSEIGVSPTDQHYHVNWDTGEPELDVAKFYRIMVSVGNQELGFADVDPVARGSNPRNARTGDAIPLTDGRTLPVKFRIENDGLCEHDQDCLKAQVGQNGGDFAAPSGHAAIRFPAGVLPSGVDEITLTIERLPVGADNRCHAENTTDRPTIELEGCYRFETEPELFPLGGFQGPNNVIVAICLENVSPSLRAGLQLFKSDDDERGLQALEDADPTGIADFDATCTGFTGTPAASPTRLIGQLTRELGRLTGKLVRLAQPRSLHAIDLGLGGKVKAGDGLSSFGWGADGTLDAVTALDESAPVDAIVPIAVRVTSVHGSISDGEVSGPVPLSGISVTFTVTGGSGTVGGEGGGNTITVSSDATGMVAVNWTLGSAPSSNTLAVTGADIDATVSYSIEAVSPPDGPQYAGSIAVFNDVNPFTSLASAPDHQQLISNLVQFSGAGRGAGTGVLFDHGKDSFCGSPPVDVLCGSFAALKTAIAGLGFTVTDASSSATSAPLTTLGSNVKVVFLVLPTQAYTVNEINALKTFASEGGRVVFFGEYCDPERNLVYCDGVSIENDLLAALGVPLAFRLGTFASPLAIAASGIRSHQITAGVAGFTFLGTSGLTLGAGATPLIVLSAPEAADIVLAAESPIETTAIIP
ncbi:MAG: hypothetical protein ACRENI_10095 [Gemmatimonadaceae bacterium]